MNCSNVTRVCRNINVYALIYIVDLLPGQRTDPSTLPFDVELAQLMPVGFNQTDFLNRVTVTHPIKEVLDSTLH